MTNTLHEHKPEYPSACTGCEHLAADLVSRAPKWMLAARASSSSAELDDSHGLDYPRPDYDPTPACRVCFKAWDTTNNTLPEYRCKASPSARVHDEGQPAPGDCRCTAQCLPLWTALLQEREGAHA